MEGLLKITVTLHLHSKVKELARGPFMALCKHLCGTCVLAVPGAERLPDVCVSVKVCHHTAVALLFIMGSSSREGMQPVGASRVVQSLNQWTKLETY